MVERRAEVVSRLRALDEATAPIVSFLGNSQLVQELRPDKQYNLHMLQECFQVRDSINLQPFPSTPPSLPLSLPSPPPSLPRTLSGSSHRRRHPRVDPADGDLHDSFLKWIRPMVASTTAASSGSGRRWRMIPFVHPLLTSC
ncbi:hypothetical protein E2562_033523 [Oryza meyeriana var. granulata]|uniref:Eukaryotic translation initiation factor 3 subunit E N-terminal domain-containing protein n=1 Tax=Oryza meyeriana var. granulata TaxID=110450 RepID=A0A6G1CKI2_9ORYZ|nr:hypothetical protein E2562_033523 [Oryza meyeriana var. granulata]